MHADIYIHINRYVCVCACVWSTSERKINNINEKKENIQKESEEDKRKFVNIRLAAAKETLHTQIVFLV